MRFIYYFVLALLVLTEIAVFASLIYFITYLSIFLITKFAYFLLQNIDKLIA